METIPNIHFMVSESRRLALEVIIKAITDNNINVIGICGLPGVGKTKMVQEMRKKKAKEEFLFDEFAFVSVGQNPDLAKVQNSIAHVLGFGEDSDPTTRTILLCKRLSQEDKRILLILDDVWEMFDLHGHGIPVEGAHGTFKILYTSRNQNLWSFVPTKMEIALGLLTEEEAWQLFKDKVGYLVDDPNLQPIAEFDCE